MKPKLKYEVIRDEDGLRFTAQAISKMMNNHGFTEKNDSIIDEVTEEVIKIIPNERDSHISEKLAKHIKENFNDRYSSEKEMINIVIFNRAKMRVIYEFPRFKSIVTVLLKSIVHYEKEDNLLAIEIRLKQEEDCFKANNNTVW